MYNGIGLLTARGSGTSGHVQSNSFNIRSHARYPQDDGAEAKPARVRKADDRILEHERKREIELKLVELADSLEENGYSTAEIEKEVQEMREQMMKEYASMSEAQKVDTLKHRDDTHALAKRKEVELERFKQAFGVRGDEEDENEPSKQPESIEGPPQRLMIENGKPPANDRFAAEEKALEEQIMREEEEEIARERELRIKRKEERQRRKEEQLAAKAAEEARIAAERAAEEEKQRLAEEDRLRAEAEHRRRNRERDGRGGHSRHPHRDSRGGRDSYHDSHRDSHREAHRSRHSEYDDRARERGYRGREGSEDRYVQEVGTMAHHYDVHRHIERSHGGYKRRRDDEPDMHEGDAYWGREHEEERDRSAHKRQARRDASGHEGYEREREESPHNGGHERTDRRADEKYDDVDQYRRSDHRGRGSGRVRNREREGEGEGEEVPRGAGRREVSIDERETVRREASRDERHANRRPYPEHGRDDRSDRGDMGHGRDDRAAREGETNFQQHDRRSERDPDREGAGERVRRKGPRDRDADVPRQDPSRHRRSGDLDDPARREVQSRADAHDRGESRAKGSGAVSDRREEYDRGYERAPKRKEGRSIGDKREDRRTSERPASVPHASPPPRRGGSRSDRSSDEDDEAQRRSVSPGRGRSASPSKSADSLSFGTSSSADS